MKVILCAVNSKYIHSNLALYSIYSSAMIYRDKYGADIGELSVKEYTINDVYDTVFYDIMSGKPDIVAFSVYIWNVSFISRLTHDIRKISPDCVIVIGGPEVSYGTGHTDLTFDYVIEGEGERALFALLAKLCNDQYIPDGSLGFRCTGGKVSAMPVTDLSEIPFPYNEGNIKRFDNRIVYYESSRGCPYSCAYCMSSIDKGVRFLGLDRVYSDIDYFFDSGVKQVKFVDRTFNCDPRRAYSIFSYIISNTKREDINFHFEVGADLFTDEIIELVSHAPSGLIQFEAGIQSTYDKALSESVRKTDLDRCFNNIRKIIDLNNINMHVDLIAGLPYEGLEEFKRSFNDVYKLNSHQLQLGFLKKLSGTRLNMLVDKHKYVFSDNPPYEILSNAYLSFDDISYLKKIEDVVDRLYNSRRFIFTLNRLLLLFNDPYSMYESIVRYFEESGYLFSPVSSRKMYEIMHSYIAKVFPHLTDDFATTLLLDYYASDKSDLTPSCLGNLVAKDKRGRAHKVIQEYRLDKSVLNSIRFVGEGIYIFDYSDKNRVSERYNYYKLI